MKPTLTLLLVTTLLGCTPDENAPAAHEATPPPRANDPLADAWRTALATGRRHDAPILVFVLPPAGQVADAPQAVATREAELAFQSLATEAGEPAPAMSTARDVMLRQLQLLRTAWPPWMTICAGVVPSSEPKMVFALTVPVVAAAETCGAKPGESVVLLTPTGERVRGFELDLLDRDAFVATVGELVLAQDVLATRCERVPPDLLADWRRLRLLTQTGGDDDARRSLEQHLSAQLPATAPLLVRQGEHRPEAEYHLWVWETQRAPLGTERRNLGHDLLGLPRSYVLKLVDR